MVSICQILCSVIDGEINTREQAAAILAEQARAYAGALNITEETASQQLRDDIKRSARYYAGAQAERILGLFEQEETWKDASTENTPPPPYAIS